MLSRVNSRYFILVMLIFMDFNCGSSLTGASGGVEASGFAVSAGMVL